MYPVSHPNGSGRSCWEKYIQLIHVWKRSRRTCSINAQPSLCKVHPIAFSRLRLAAAARRRGGGVPTCVDDLVDDLGHMALQEGMEQLDQEQQTGAEDEQRARQEDQTHHQVRQLGGRKQMSA